MGYIGKQPTPVPLTASDITDGIITSAKISDGTIATADIADSAVTKAKTSGVTSDMFRNLVINGDMRIAQRATSATNFSGGYDTVDRFGFDESLGTGVGTSEQEALTSGGAYDAGFRTAVKMSCTTADTSPSADERAYMYQNIEAQNLQQLKYGSSNAETITLSFWAKSNMTGNFPVTIKKDDNTVHYIVHSFNISSANTWQKFTFTITATQGSTNLITQSAAKINNDNGRGMQIFWGLYWGSNYTGSYSGTPTWTTTSNDFADSDVTYNNFFSSTSNNLSITGVQLEVGTSASDFEFLPTDVSLQRCQRYFYKLVDVPSGDAGGYFSAGYYYSASTLYVWTEFPTTMRSSPTLTSSNGTDYFIFYRNGAADNLPNFTLTIGRLNGAMLRNNSDVSGTGGQAGGVHTSSNSILTFSAEL